MSHKKTQCAGFPNEVLLKIYCVQWKNVFFFFLLRHLKLTNFRAVIAVTKHCETVYYTEYFC